MTDPFADADLLTASNAALARIAALFARHQEASTRLAALLAEVAEVKKTVTAIEETDFPALFAELGVESLVTADGWKLRLANEYRATLENPAVLAKAVAFARAHEGEGLIASTVTATFGRGDEQLAAALGTRLAQEFGDRVATRETMNTTSFKAFIRELHEEKGLVALPDDIGVFVRRVVIPKPPKSSSSKNSERTA